jgi:hypothetical protein
VGKCGRWKVTGKVRATENMRTTLGQDRGEVAWGDDVGEEGCGSRCDGDHLPRWR